MFESTLRFANRPEIGSIVSAMKDYTTLKKISTKTVYYEKKLEHFEIDRPKFSRSKISKCFIEIFH